MFQFPEASVRMLMVNGRLMEMMLDQSRLQRFPVLGLRHHRLSFFVRQVIFFYVQTSVKIRH